MGERLTISVERAGEMLGISRPTAYKMARNDELPVPVIRIGRRLLVPLAPLEELLGIQNRTPTKMPPVARRVLRILSSKRWVSRRELIKRLGNVTSDVLTETLETLERDGVAARQVVPTSGRPREEWRLWE